MWPILAIAMLAFAFYSQGSKTVSANPKPGNSGGVPGFETDDIESAHPWFRDRYNRLLDRMRDAGFSPRTARVARDSVRQRYYYDNGLSKVLQSYHTVSRDGRPEAFAADVYDSRYSPDDERQVSFYLALMNAAPDYQLRTGGTFSKTTAWLAKHGLGWDPGHVEPAAGITSIAKLHRGERPDGF